MLARFYCSQKNKHSVDRENKNSVNCEDSVDRDDSVDCKDSTGRDDSVDREDSVDC
jgi:hypothetical protein